MLTVEIPKLATGACAKATAVNAVIKKIRKGKVFLSINLIVQLSMQ